LSLKNSDSEAARIKNAARAQNEICMVLLHFLIFFPFFYDILQ